MNCAGLQFPEGTTAFINKRRGQAIRIRVRAPSTYDITLSENAAYQGPLCVPPAQAERQLLLAVPPEIDPRVRLLESKIERGISNPRRRAGAIERYLLTHHKYSLRVDIGPGDPVSNFLLQGKAAHCEYFASAAVILTRLAGVPSRYIIGYSGHEQDAGGVTVVRQRDAHAWAECWIDGTGWVVLDATPGDGRPDALTEQPNAFARMIERFQDTLTALKLGAHREALLWLAGISFGLFVVIAGIRGLLSLLKSGKARGPALGYSITDAELAALFREFEASCRKIGLVCPPSQTWTEYLASFDVADEPVKASPRQIEVAAAFVQTYNRARFGQRAPNLDLAPMRAAIAEIRGSAPEAAVSHG